MRTLIYGFLVLGPLATSDGWAKNPAQPKEEQVPACLAALTGSRPAGWLDAGKVLVSIVNDKATTMRVQNAAGKAVWAGRANSTSDEETRESIRQALCKIDGTTIGLLIEDPVDPKVLTVPILRPPKEDEAADLALLCTKPTELPAGAFEFAGAEQRKLAMILYATRLTSPRYRRWLYEQNRAAKATDYAAQRKLSDELGTEALRHGRTFCWFMTPGS